jgi:hypothetical protein
MFSQSENSWRAETPNVQNIEKNKFQKKGGSSTSKRYQQKTPKLHMFPVSGSASHNKENAIACCEEILRIQGILPAAEEPEQAVEAKPEDTVIEKVDECGDATSTAVTKKSNDVLPTVNNIPNLGYFTSQENFHSMLDADGMFRRHCNVQAFVINYVR